MLDRLALIPLFLLASASATSAQVRADSAERGVVTGTVIDAATGDPLEGAVVALEPLPAGVMISSRTEAGFWRASRTTTSGATGAYRFDRLVPGTYRLLVRRLGYRPVALEVELGAEIPLRVSVGLVVRPIRLEPENVVALSAPFAQVASIDDELDGGRLDAELYRQRTFAAGDARLLTRSDLTEAVTLGESDLFRAFHRMPGVSTRDDFTAELWTRGAPWGQTRVYFDGLPLFNPVHTVGVFSGINPDGVGSVFFHPGVRSASLGEGAAALLDVGSRRATPGFDASAEVSVVSARAAVNQGIGDRGGWTFAARRSYVDLVRSYLDLVTDMFDDSAGVGTVPYAFFDLTSRLDIPVGSSGALQVSGFWERDEVRGQIPDFLDATRGNWGNAVGRVSLAVPVGPVYTSHTIGISSFNGRLNETAFRLDAGAPLAERTEAVPVHEPMRNSLTYAVLRSQIEPASGNWTAGWEVVRQRQVYSGPRPRPYPQAIFLDSLKLQDTLWMGSVWGEHRWRQGSMTLVTGLRADIVPGVTNVGPVALGPRVSLRLALGDRTTVSMGFGRSFQYSQAFAPAGTSVGPALHLTDVWLTASDTIPAIRSDVVTAGIERWLGGAWLGGVHLYGRHTVGVAEPDPKPGALGNRSIFVQASGGAAGVEFSLRRLAGRWTTSVAYSHAIARMLAQEIYYPASADRRQVLDATLMARMGNSLRVGGALTAASGAPFTRFVLQDVRDSLVTDPDSAVLSTKDVETANQERTAAYVSADLLTEWSHDFGSVRLGVSLQLRNVFNRRNAVTYVGSRLGGCSGARSDDRVTRNVSGRPVCDRFDRGLPILPLLGVSVAF